MNDAQREAVDAERKRIRAAIAEHRTSKFLTQKRTKSQHAIERLRQAHARYQEKKRCGSFKG